MEWHTKREIQSMALVTDDFVFIHVPKTGGTYCRRVIEACCPEAHESGPGVREGHPLEEHYGIEEIQAKHKELATKRFVGFVRHPVTWYPSRWAWAFLTHYDSKRYEIPEAKAHWMNEVWSMDFNTFISNVIEVDEPRALQTFAQKLQVANQWVRSIGRYEYLEKDLRRLTGCYAKDVEPQRVGAQKLNIKIRPSAAMKLCQLEYELVREFYQD